MELRGRRVLITGASSGIGEATALALAAEGAVLAISGRNAARLAEVADRVAAGGHARPVVLVADLAEPGGASRRAGR